MKCFVCFDINYEFRTIPEKLQVEAPLMLKSNIPVTRSRWKSPLKIRKFPTGILLPQKNIIITQNRSYPIGIVRPRNERNDMRCNRWLDPDETLTFEIKRRLTYALKRLELLITSTFDDIDSGHHSVFERVFSLKNWTTCFAERLHLLSFWRAIPSFVHIRI